MTSHPLLYVTSFHYLLVDPEAHRLNMELDLQSLFGLHVQCTAVLIGWDPPPRFLSSYTRALLVSQDRRHLSVTPCRSLVNKIDLPRSIKLCMCFSSCGTVSCGEENWSLSADAAGSVPSIMERRPADEDTFTTRAPRRSRGKRAWKKQFYSSGSGSDSIFDNKKHSVEAS